MKFSKQWIQEYIVENLPEDDTIECELNAKAFEVESIEDYIVDDKKCDSIFDIKVLPNRSHDALGHYGMAREICACLGLTLKDKIEIYKTDFNFDTNSKSSVEKVNVNVIDVKACPRFMAVRIDGVSVGESPLWLKEKLDRIGQRSINNIVDITNYVQYTLNKPMHAYDVSSIEDGIVVRYASLGENLETLDDRELELNKNGDEKVLVIADSKKALGLAGIKGGKWSGINSETTSIIIESANFEPSLIRKTSQKYNIKTDASKRFENGIADSLVLDGLMMTVSEIHKMFPEAKVGAVTDIYENKSGEYWTGLTVENINQTLGSDFSKLEIENTLNRLGFKYEIVVPDEYIKNNYKKCIDAEYKNPSSMRVDAPKFFSCSSLVSYLYKGIWMPSLSVDKYVFSKKLEKSDLVFGDLIFANSGEGKIRYESVEYMRGTPVPEGVDHVGIYIGDDNVLHATKLRGKVLVESLHDFEKDRKIIGYGRICNDLDKERYVIAVPSERLDLRIKEDMIEEIGRIIGYDKLKPVLPTINKIENKIESRVGKVNKKLYYQNVIRNILIEQGFSEVITYSFVSNGEVELIKSASDKNKLRTNISTGLVDSLQKNINNMPLLNVQDIKVFEFGNCFTHDREWTSFAVGIDDGKKKSNFSKTLESIISEIKIALNVTDFQFESKSTKPLVIELDFDKLISQLPEATENIYLENKTENIKENKVYKSFSQMPFVVRDVAFWADTSIDTSDIEKMITEKAGELCVSINPFDKFIKDSKTSYGYRLVYQDKDRTLTDIEVNGYAENVYNALKERGFEIR